MFVTWVSAHLRHNDPSSMKRHLQPFKTNNLEMHKFMVHKKKFPEHGFGKYIVCETAQMFVKS